MLCVVRYVWPLYLIEGVCSMSCARGSVMMLSMTFSRLKRPSLTRNWFIELTNVVRTAITL